MLGLMPFFCFYGGKWRAAPHYPAPLFDHIIEPFAGAAGYATRYYDRRVTLVERDPVVAALWRYLVAVKPSEILALPLVVEDTRALPVTDEARSLIGFWLNKGSTGPRRAPSSWMRSGIRPKSMWGAEIRARIATQIDKIRHWVIIEGTFDDVPDERATYFVDPPYEKAGVHYRFHVVDYPALAEWCRRRRGQTIVCENVGADWLPFRSFRMVKGLEGVRGGKRSAEAIWTQENS